MINFKAKPIYPVNIMKIDGVGYRTKTPANFVELESNSYSDVLALSRAAMLWDKENNNKTTLAAAIFSDFVDDYTKPEFKFFAVTKQMEGFDRLNPDDILGIAEVKPLTSKMQELVLLQTRPRDKFISQNRKYTEVGRNLVESIISLFPKKDLLVEPLAEARDFYFKLGFKSQILSRFLRFYAR